MYVCMYVLHCSTIIRCFIIIFSSLDDTRHTYSRKCLQQGCIYHLAEALSLSLSLSLSDYIISLIIIIIIIYITSPLLNTSLQANMMI